MANKASPLAISCGILLALMDLASIHQGAVVCQSHKLGMFAGMGAIVILFWIIGLLATVFWIWMLIDCLTSNLPTTEKLIWAIVIVFTHIVGRADLLLRPPRRWLAHGDDLGFPFQQDALVCERPLKLGK